MQVTVRSSKISAIAAIANLIAFGFVCLSPLPALAQTTVPSNLQVVGTITGANGVNPEVNDIVQAVRPTSTGTVEGQGSVLASDGTYFIDISKTQDFNGTVLTLVLRKSTGVYQLNSGSSAVSFPYSGTFPFPARLSQNVTVGSKISGAGGGGSNPGDDAGQNETFDVNGDGSFNQTDIDLIKGSLGKSRPDAVMDVNSDGVVNTRDVIDAIKAYNTGRSTRVKPASTTTTTTTP